ncbi:hypothetical protein GCM10027052_24420 [Parafrigoribacterium mesophilum]|uniref:N,N-dimethylformamidase beta subunit family domain-containing protein n=1 Tax=Parafrigoribacterium mesophilum TaxID=433646 RepID=UPI0031FE0D27
MDWRGRSSKIAIAFALPILLALALVGIITTINSARDAVNSSRWAATSASPSSDACGPSGNAITCENSKPGQPASVWDINGAGDPSIQGFATDISADIGSRIDFKIDTTATKYTIDVYRSGWYQGLGARKVARVTPSATLPQTQPPCITNTTTEIYDCGNWSVSASWDVPPDAVSGVYFALLTRTDTGGQSHIMFVVRDMSSHADILFQTSDTTWQAYNSYGGSDFYQGAAHDRAYKISYNRPLATRNGVNERSFYFDNQYPLVRFLEKNGYDVSYFSAVDTDRFGANLLNHRVFLSVGHDEYWSAQQRKNVTAARDAGVNLQFLSGNEMYWHTRYEPSADSSATPYRTLVCYKESWNDAKIDPSPEWTGSWRDGRYAPQSQGAGLPENALTGTIYMVDQGDLPVTVSAEEGKLRVWRNTPLASLAPGTSRKLAEHTIGYESDEDLDNGFRPNGLIHLSTTTGQADATVPGYESSKDVVPGVTTHHLTLYRAASGALVFSAGSVQWTWGLDSEHDGDGAPADPNMQQAQVNLLADMGAQPASLTDSLTRSGASTDDTAPTTTINTPTTGTTVTNGSEVTVTGTASDAEGQVAGVELSTDGGTTWHAAAGTADWEYKYFQEGIGARSVQARAIDDSGNFSANPESLTLNVTGPFSVFGAQPAPTPAVSDPTPVELGLRFSPTQRGVVTGVRFFKGPGNDGVHTGSLWSASGKLLAQVDFSGESDTGWQSARFPSPVSVAADTTYVVSYSAPQGHYAATDLYWMYRGRDAGPLRVAGGYGAAPAGVFSFTPGSFPRSTYQQSNYFVDAVFRAD